MQDRGKRRPANFIPRLFWSVSWALAERGTCKLHSHKNFNLVFLLPSSANLADVARLLSRLVIAFFPFPHVCETRYIWRVAIFTTDAGRARTFYATPAVTLWFKKLAESDTGAALDIAAACKNMRPQLVQNCLFSVRYSLYPSLLLFLVSLPVGEWVVKMGSFNLSPGAGRTGH